MKSGSPRGILIVEDERLVATDLQQTLSDLGYDPFAIADSSDTAIASAMERRPDLVLMDIRIRGARDGIQTAEVLRSRFRVGVIYLTAHADQPMVDRAKLTEPYGYLIKPVKVTELRTSIDIALHRQEAENARENLQAVQHRLYGITDNVPLFITYVDRDQRVQFANRVAELQMGFTPGQVLGQHVREFLGEQRYFRVKPLMDAAMSGERRTHELTEKLPSGALQYMQVTYVPDLKGGELEGLYVIAADMTELHRSYERIRELAQRLESIQGEERRQIARMLHEGISQDLAVAQVRLIHLETQTKDGDYIAQLCAELRQALKRCMQALRQSSNDMRPTEIVFGSLVEALEDHARAFGELSGLRVQVRVEGAIPALDETTRLLYFRAAQEALTNAARYAKANTVQMILGDDGENFRLEILDNGIGISDDALDKPGSFGLLGMREQFEARGGGLMAERQHAGGTKVSVFLPNSAVQPKPRPN
jgi:PAS domain S-box-containing protein